MTYEKYAEIFDTVKNPDKGKPLCRNTRLFKDNKNNFVVRYHETDIVVVMPNNQYILSNGGWRTPSTRDRINRFSPAKISQRKYIWYMQNGEKFFSGIIIDSTGKVISSALVPIQNK